MAYHNGRMITNCSRYSLAGFGSYQRNPDLPPITADQVEALDAIHFTATRNAMRIPNDKGDLLYINNMALLHARDALQTKSDGNSSEALSKRHKLRLFLRDPALSWKIPSGLNRVWEQLYGPNTADGQRQEHFIIEPEHMAGTRWKSNG